MIIAVVDQASERVKPRSIGSLAMNAIIMHRNCTAVASLELYLRKRYWLIILDTDYVPLEIDRLEDCRLHQPQKHPKREAPGKEEQGMRAREME